MDSSSSHFQSFQGLGGLLLNGIWGHYLYYIYAGIHILYIYMDIYILYIYVNIGLYIYILCIGVCVYIYMIIYDFLCIYV